MTFTKIGTILALMASLNGTPVKQHRVYIRTMEVIRINCNTNTVTCVDTVGMKWKFKGIKDYEKKDLVSCLMDTMGTKKIKDDVVLDHWYTGYWVE